MNIFFLSDHPIVHQKCVTSPEEPSVHVHWAEKLTQTLPYIPRPDSIGSSSSDTFITCSGDEQEHPNKLFSDVLLVDENDNNNVKNPELLTKSLSNNCTMSPSTNKRPQLNSTYECIPKVLKVNGSSELSTNKCLQLNSISDCSPKIFRENNGNEKNFVNSRQKKEEIHLPYLLHYLVLPSCES